MAMLQLHFVAEMEKRTTTDATAFDEDDGPPLLAPGERGDDEPDDQAARDAIELEV